MYFVYYILRLSSKSFSKRIGHRVEERTKLLKAENEQLNKRINTLTESNKVLEESRNVLKLQAEELRNEAESEKKQGIKGNQFH